MSAQAATTIDLPPLFALIAPGKADDTFAYACRIASDEGAGAFVFGGRADLLDIAVVLEPDEPLASARRAFYPCMVALADAIAAHCPPEKPLSIGWPDAVLFDGALMGGGRLGWPAGCREDETPDWLVFSAMLLVAKVGAGDPGLTPMSTSFEEEGLEEDARERIAESFASYLMLGFDVLKEDGFAPIANRYIRRLTRHESGDRLAIGPDGDLLVHGETGEPERLPLGAALAQPAWLDAGTGMVRL